MNNISFRYSNTPISFTSSSVESNRDMELYRNGLKNREFDSEIADQSYHEFIRRLSPRQIEQIEKRLSALENPDRFIEGLLDAIDGNWDSNNPYISHEDMPAYALLAFKQGRDLDNFRLGTLLHYWAAGQYHREYHQSRHRAVPPFNPIVLEPYHQSGQPNDHFFQTIVLTFLPSDGEFVDEVVTVSEGEKARFFAEVETLPKSEQRVFILDALVDDEDEKSILDAFDDIAYTVFWRIDNDHILLVSVGMMQAFINATHRGREPAVRLNPVLGFSSLKDLRKNGLETTKDMVLHFFGLNLSRYPDGVLGPWNYSTGHDLYHAKRQDDIGAKWTSKLMGFADQFSLTGTGKERRIQTKSKWVLTELDFVFFRDRAYTKPEACWLALGDSFRRNKCCSKLSFKVETELLERICNDSEMTENLDVKLKKLRKKAKGKNEGLYDPIFETRAFKRLPSIWREQRGIGSTFLAQFKQSILKAENATQRKELVEKMVPYVSAKNCAHLFEFSLDNSQQCQPLKESCLNYFFKHRFAVLRSEGFKDLEKRRPIFAQFLRTRIPG